MQSSVNRPLFPGNIISLSSVRFDNEIHVSKNGDDATGERNNLNKPFETLTAAKNAAVVFDTVIVHPGNYDERDLIKNEVDWHFLSGARVVYTGPSPGAVFDNSAADGVAGPVGFNITGDGFIDYQGTGNGSSFKSVIYLDNPLSVCDLDIRAIRSKGNTAGYGNQDFGALFANSGLIKGKVKQLNGSWWCGPSGIINLETQRHLNSYSITETGSKTFIRGQFGNAKDASFMQLGGGQINIHYDRVEIDGGDALAGGRGIELQGDINGTLSVDHCEMLSTGAFGAVVGSSFETGFNLTVKGKYLNRRNNANGHVFLLANDASIDRMVFEDVEMNAVNTGAAGISIINNLACNNYRSRSNRANAGTGVITIEAGDPFLIDPDV